MTQKARCHTMMKWRHSTVTLESLALNITSGTTMLSKINKK